VNSAPASAAQRIVKLLQQQQALEQARDAAGLRLGLTAASPLAIRLLRALVVHHHIQWALRRLDADRVRRRRRRGALLGIALVLLIAAESARRSRWDEEAA
jgi:hypothetical protein